MTEPKLPADTSWIQMTGTSGKLYGRMWHCKCHDEPMNRRKTKARERRWSRRDWGLS